MDTKPLIRQMLSKLVKSSPIAYTKTVRFATPSQRKISQTLLSDVSSQVTNKDQSKN